MLVPRLLKPSKFIQAWRSWSQSGSKVKSGTVTRFLSMSSRKYTSRESSTSILGDGPSLSVLGLTTDPSSQSQPQNNPQSQPKPFRQRLTPSSREPLKLSPEQIQEITGNDPEILQKLNFILMEIELMRQEGHNVPSFIKPSRWPELLQLSSKHQRRNFYTFLFKIEMKNLNDKAKKEEKLRALGPIPPRPTMEEDPYWMTYGISRNTIFLRLYDSTMNKFYHSRVINEMVHGSPPLILDCGYDQHMTLREAKNCAQQIELLLTENRENPHPFSISMCNFGKESQSKVAQELLKRIPTLYDPDYAINVHDESYLDLQQYPKEKLVYLSPHASEEMKTWDDDSIYIVGAMVDKSDPRPFSIAKAKREGLRSVKLPLDRWVDWGLGNKSLTLNQMISILLELRRTSGDWEKALKFVPRRKLKRPEDQAAEDEIQRQKTLKLQRRERSSQVLKDYDLISSKNRSRGNFNTNNPNYMPIATRRSSNNNTKLSVKTIMNDY